MPELPEVETVKETLNKYIQGLSIKQIELTYEPMIKNVSVPQFKEKLQNQKIEEITRRGKYLIFHLDDYYLLSHLRMEGKYFYQEAGTEVLPHVHATFKLSNGKQLFYQDTRKFGTFHLYDKSTNLEETPSLGVLGVEPFSEAFNEAYLKTKLQNRKRPIKSLLLDQSIVCGLGNIYADEVLFLAKIHPLTPSLKLTKKARQDVIKYTKEVLDHAIKLKGTTIKTFSSGHGEIGAFQNQLQIHLRQGEPCNQCQTIIEKIKVGGRGTYYCKQCQKEE